MRIHGTVLPVFGYYSVDLKDPTSGNLRFYINNDRTSYPRPPDLVYCDIDRGALTCQGGIEGLDIKTTLSISGTFNTSTLVAQAIVVSDAFPDRSIPLTLSFTFDSLSRPWLLINSWREVFVWSQWLECGIETNVDVGRVAVYAYDPAPTNPVGSIKFYWATGTTLDTVIGTPTNETIFLPWQFGGGHYHLSGLSSIPAGSTHLLTVADHDGTMGIDALEIFRVVKLAIEDSVPIAEVPEGIIYNEIGSDVVQSVADSILLTRPTQNLQAFKSSQRSQTTITPKRRRALGAFPMTLSSTMHG